MRVLPALALVVVLCLSPGLTQAREDSHEARSRAAHTSAIASHPDPVPTPQIPTDSETPARDQAGSLVTEAFTAAARSGADESRPRPTTRPRTINARAHGNNHQAPPPAPGVGRKVRVQAYAYHLRGFTARGTRTQLGTVAVDPRVIPMGSKLYIPGYGWGRAVDTGGAIQGRKIDVWLPTLSQCLQWGVRDVTITVVP
jgi:3D (Asp-Asp-Asp) domain-containing protein